MLLLIGNGGVDMMETDLSVEFWKKYFVADILEKRELLKTLPILKNVYELKGLEDSLFEYCFLSLIKDYVDDAVKAALSLKEAKP